MIFRQLFDYETWTYTYLLADEQTREAVLVDSVKEQVERDLKLLSELELKLKYALDTHVHADHITGAGLLRERTGCQTGLSEYGGAHCADLNLQEDDELTIGSTRIRVLSTPGHTNGCASYLVGDRVFTGDALLVRGTGRTDFQQGDAGRLYDSITARLFTLPDDTRVYPGHDYKGHETTTIGEEKRHNPRLAGKSRDQFIEIMSNLKLAHPKKIQEAVPANLQCGLDRNEPRIVDHLIESSLTASEGHRELSPEGLRRQLGSVRIVDVREPSEFNDSLGHVPGSELAPVGTLSQAAQGWDREAPLVLVCRSGRRGVAGAQTLQGMGFKHLFNLTGGMLAWDKSGFPAETDHKPAGLENLRDEIFACYLQMNGSAIPDEGPMPNLEEMFRCCFEQADASFEKPTAEGLDAVLNRLRDQAVAAGLPGDQVEEHLSHFRKQLVRRI